MRAAGFISSWATALCTMMIVVVTVLASGCGEHPKAQRQTERNPPSRGWLDAPTPNAVVGPVFVVAGWAADESGVKIVRIYLDDELAATTETKLPRPDVDVELPQFSWTGPNHGFSVTVDAGSRAGYCTIRAEALDGKGALTRFTEVTVRIEP